MSGKTGGRWRLGKLLVVSQVAMSLLLLIGAGLFVRSLQNLENLDVGYPRNNLVLAEIDPVASGYKNAQVPQLVRQLLEKLRAIPGVSAATFSENGLFSGSESGGSIQVLAGQTRLSDPNHPPAR